VCVNLTQVCVNLTQACVNLTRVCVNPTQVCVNLSQACVNLTQADKWPALLGMVAHEVGEGQRALVFVNTKRLAQVSPSLHPRTPRRAELS
jgi:hypothetical protein